MCCTMRKETKAIYCLLLADIDNLEILDHWSIADVHYERFNDRMFDRDVDMARAILEEILIPWNPVLKACIR